MTPVHDHVTWCVAGVVAGTEHEELFELAGGRADGRLVQTVVRDNVTGSVSGFAPPGDIHRVRNATEQTAISIHVYGADISRLGSSDPALLRPARTRRSALTPTATGRLRPQPSDKSARWRAARRRAAHWTGSASLRRSRWWVPGAKAQPQSFSAKCQAKSRATKTGPQKPSAKARTPGKRVRFHAQALALNCPRSCRRSMTSSSSRAIRWRSSRVSAYARSSSRSSY